MLNPDAYLIRYESNGKQLTLKTQMSFSTFTSKKPNSGDAFEVTITTNREIERLNRESGKKEAALKKETAAKE